MIRSAAGLLLTLVAAELFWRSAATSSGWKIASITALLAGLLLVGWRRSSWAAHVTVNAVFGIACGAYLAFAAARYPGLIKDAWPHETAARWILFGQGTVVAFFAASVVTASSSVRRR